jgi:hypothetical protein
MTDPYPYPRPLYAGMGNATGNPNPGVAPPVHVQHADLADLLAVLKEIRDLAKSINCAQAETLAAIRRL